MLLNTWLDVSQKYITKFTFSALGPWAHLFHRVHEQSYVAHVIGYSAAIGPYADESYRPTPRYLPHYLRELPIVRFFSRKPQSNLFS